MPLNLEAVIRLEIWMAERDSIRMKKEAGMKKPWTSDPILQRFRFCNVRREDDKVTQWFAEHWRNELYWWEPNFIPAIMLGRTINWPDTLMRLGFPLEWNKERYLEILDQLQAQGKKVYTGAYMITAGPTGVRKNAWVLGNAETYFQHPPKMYGTLESSWRSVQDYPCVGPFIAGQIIADLKHTKHLAGASDWMTWAPVGPGSMRGLNRCYSRPVKTQISQEQGLEEMREIAAESRTVHRMGLCLQDVQNCLCEFDKYERVRLGEGKPRSSYPGI